MENDFDTIKVEDDEGNELELAIGDELVFDGERYALLFDAESESDEVYIMKIRTEGEDEYFLPIDGDEFERVSKYIDSLDDEDEIPLDDEDEISLDD